jgi:hypothetical protein
MRPHRHFLIRHQSRTLQGSGLQKQFRKFVAMPLSVTHLRPMAQKLGITSGGRGVLLLDKENDPNIVGTGFHVKSPNPALLDKLQNLALKSVQGIPIKKKNIRIQF